jgi:DNA gyrase subunit B
MTQTSTAYDGSAIQVLKGLEAVRMRPGMYIGDSGKKGLHHLIWEIVDNSVDEAMAGHADRIGIVIEDDGETISVEDNGRGIPVDMHPTEKKPTLEVVLTTLHAGGKFGGSGYAASGGLHGVGASCVTALSERMTATVFRDGEIHAMTFSRGGVVEEMKNVGKMKRGQKSGTHIQWRADPEIFKAGVELDEKILTNRLREVAYLNRGLTVAFENKKSGTKYEFKFDGGIADYVSYLTEDKTGQYPSEPIFIEGQEDDMRVQIALMYTEDEDETVLTFCNNINTVDGGTHLSGFRSALTRVINNFYKSVGGKKDKDENLGGNDVREGLTAVVSVLVPQPELVGQTKAKLGTVKAEGITSAVTTEQLTAFFEKNAPIVKQIIERAKLAQRARNAARKSADIIKRKGVFGTGGGMPGKLYDCQNRDRSKTELYIVEGDSAAGSAKGGRDASTQAIMPIRGKMINAEKHGLAALLKNKEVVDLIKAIGTGIKDDFDIDKLRYGKIIIMADADDDGSHIATLLMTFFFRFMKPLVTGGHLYMAVPPLYAVRKGTKTIYCWNDEDKDNGLKELSGGKVTRFKGLGEMDEEQLGDTTMDPANRRLIRLEINDLAEAERVVTVLMGSNVGARKERLKENINS